MSAAGAQAAEGVARRTLRGLGVPGLLRGVGLGLVIGSASVLLWLAWLLFGTGIQTSAAQRALGAEFAAALHDPAADDGFALSLRGEESVVLPIGQPGSEVAAPVPAGSAMAVLRFHRAGSPPPVSDTPLFVVAGVDQESLRRGPGHYPATAQPGGAGNFAIAGHRTTYGAPFFDLDDLVAGDEVLVTDRNGTHWTYEIVELRVVAADDGSVLGPDPLGTGAPTITFTTCHPRFSNAQRLIAFGRLVT